MVKPLISEPPEELIKGKLSREDPIKKRDITIHGKRYRLRSYKPEAMRELCQTCLRINICDHVLQPLPSEDGTSLCIEYNPDLSTRACPNCKKLNKIGVADVRCFNCGVLLFIPNPFLRINRVRIDEEGNIRKIIKRNIKE